jgi:anti-anti-sigma factor
MEEGRGIQLMEHVMDRVEYFSGGRHLVLSKRIEEKGGAFLTLAKERGQAGPLRVSLTSGVLVASLTLPSRDEAAVDAAFKSVLGAMSGKDLRMVVLDLTQVGFMTSHAIGRLVSLYKTCLRTGLCLRVGGVSRDLKKVFAEMHLDSLFASYDRLEEAVEAP